MMKTLAAGLIVVLALLVAAVLVVPGQIDWNRYRPWLAAELSAIAGRTVHIDGDFSFEMLPVPRLRARDVRLASPGGTAYPTMARVDSLDMQVRFLPLLRGELAIERLDLAEPVVVLEWLADGSTNWSRPEGGDLGRGEAGGVLAGLARSAAFDRVTVEDGTVILHDGAAAAGRQIAGVQARISAAGLGGPVELDGRFEIDRRPIGIALRTGRVTATGAWPVNLTLEPEVGAGTLRFAGLIGPGPAAQGDLSAQAPDLAATLNRLDPALPVPDRLARSFAARASLLAGAERIELNGLAIEFGAVRATGAFGIALETPPRAELRLAVNHLDLDDWLGPPQPWRLADGDPGDLPAPALPLSWAASLELSVPAIGYNGQIVRQARLEAAMDAGTLSVRRLSAQLPGGSDLAMIGSLSTGDGEPRFEMSAELGSNDLRGLLGWLGQEPAGLPSERLRRFTAAFTLAGMPNDFRLTGLDVTLDNTRLTGGLAYADRGRPGLGVAFEIDRLDLDAYRGLAAGFPGAEPVDRSWADRLAWLRRFDANVEGRIGTLALDGLALDRVEINGALRRGGVILHRAAIGSVAGASVAVTGSVAALAPLAGLDLDLDFRAPSAEPVARALGMALPVPAEALGALSLAGRVRTEEDGRLGLTLAAGAAGGTVSLGGTVTDPAGSPDLALGVRVIHPDLPGLIRAVLPEYRPAGEPGGIDLYARLRHAPAGDRPRRLAIEGLQGSIGPVSVVGQADLEVGDAARPRFDAELRTSAIVLDPFLPARHAAGSGRSWWAGLLDPAMLGAADGTLALTAAAIETGGFRISDPALRAELRDGRLTLSQLSGGAFGGTLGVSGRIAAASSPAAEVEVNLVGARLDEVLEAAFGSDALSGTLDFGLTLRLPDAGWAGAGRSNAGDREWLAGATGSGLIAVRDGAVAGLDLNALVELLDRPGVALDRLQPVLTAGRTAFAALNAPFAIEGAVASTETMRLVTEAGIGEGRGTYDLAGNRLNLDLEFGLYRHPGAPPLGVGLSGPPDAPVRRLDLDALHAHLARRTAATQADD